MVEHRHRLLAAVQPLEKENRPEQVAALRGKELRVYKRAAYCFDGLWLYGQAQNHARH